MQHDMTRSTAIVAINNRDHSVTKWKKAVYKEHMMGIIDTLQIHNDIYCWDMYQVPMPFIKISGLKHRDIIVTELSLTLKNMVKKSATSYKDQFIFLVGGLI